MANIEASILSTLHEDGQVQDTGDFAQSIGVDHQAVVGVMKSLEAAEMIICEAIEHFKWVLTPEAKEYLGKGSPEAQVRLPLHSENYAVGSMKRCYDGNM